MLTEPRTYTTLEARCPGCGDSYAGESLLFLYADELGARCPGPGPGPGCGSILAVGNAGGWRGEDRNFCCHLVLPEDLEGSGLHQMLAEITAGGGEVAGCGGLHGRGPDHSSGTCGLAGASVTRGRPKKVR